MTTFFTGLSTGPDGCLVCEGLDYVEFDARLARDGDCAPTTKAAYMALSSFAGIEERITLTTEAVATWSAEARYALLPYRKTVAACMGRSVKTLDRATADLVDRQILAVHPQTAPGNEAVADANLYQLLDRERWAQQLLQRAAAPTPTPVLGPDGRPVPRVQRAPGIDYVRLDARIARTGERSPNYKSVYAAIATFVNIHNRAITDRPPTVKELMACTGLGRTAVTDVLAQMRADGLLLMQDNFLPAQDGGGRVASSYFLLDARLWRARAAARDDREIAAFTGGWRHQADMGGDTTRTGVASPGGHGWGHHTDIIKSSSENSRSEPLPDARRATTGGLPRAARSARSRPKPNPSSGTAATKTTKPHTKTIRTTASKPVPREEEVFAMVDALGVSKHPAIKVPPLRRAVRDLLSAGRTPEHALARINAGWWRARVPERIKTGEIRGPVGYLATILSSRECERPDCERGLILGSGEECRACGLRAAERQARRAQEYLEQETIALDQVVRPARQRRTTPQPAPTTWRCQAPGPDGLGGGPCGRPGTGTAPEPAMCPDCLESLRQALAR
ncbi:hypothetical protein [Streptomyces sp. NRRL S-350]|uniref:hypothetical protein n=1 Tax=Streptomyces sp. NRRL S-350 TaxID=1463902 RepID=UPI0004C20154|nr:hypothetical protein [Streptomyces sp. NRRL S-350]